MSAVRLVLQRHSHGAYCNSAALGMKCPLDAWGSIIELRGFLFNTLGVFFPPPPNPTWVTIMVFGWTERAILHLYSASLHVPLSRIILWLEYKRLGWRLTHAFHWLVSLWLTGHTLCPSHPDSMDDFALVNFRHRPDSKLMISRR